MLSERIVVRREPQIALVIQAFLDSFAPDSIVVKNGATFNDHILSKRSAVRVNRSSASKASIAHAVAFWVSVSPVAPVRLHRAGTDGHAPRITAICVGRGPARGLAQR